MMNLIKKLLNIKSYDAVNTCGIKEEDKTAIFYALDGETERKTGEFEKSVQSMSKAIELEPDNDMFYITRALSYKELKNYQAALKDVEKAIELNNKVKNSHNIKEEILSLMEV